MRHRTFVMLGIALGLAGVVHAQELRTPLRERDAATQLRQERTALRPSTKGAQTDQSLDRPIAACLILGNREEVAMAKFAQERAQNEQVKQFAKKMGEAHQQAAAKLEKFAPQGVSLTLNGQDGTSTDRSATNRTGVDRTAATQPGRINATDDSGDTQHQMLEMQKTIAQECLNLTQRELSEKEGAKFDQCYMAQQIGAHIGMLAKLTGSEQFASAELQPVIEQQQQTVQQHLQMAKQIMQQLESESNTTRQ